MTRSSPTRQPQYEPVPGWDGFLGPDVTFAGDATAVAVDSQDRVFVFNRGPVPVIIFDANGHVVDSWGEGDFVCPHAIEIDDDDNVYLVDSRGGHVVQKRSPEGHLLMELGRRGQSSRWQSGEPFHSPTDVAVDPRYGDIFVSDGYGNSRIHRFDADGRHILSWGSPGGDPGQFYLPHSIAFLDNDHLIVCDRENFRLQIFTRDGEFVDQWHAFRPCAIAVSKLSGLVYLAELGPAPAYHGLPELGSRVRVMTRDGTRVATVGSTTPGHNPDEFMAPHGISFDSYGTMYVAEVSRTWGRDYLKLNSLPANEPISLKKWQLIADEGD